MNDELDLAPGVWLLRVLGFDFQLDLLRLSRRLVIGRREDQVFFIVIWLPWEVERLHSALSILQGSTITLLLPSARLLRTSYRCGFAVYCNNE